MAFVSQARDVYNALVREDIPAHMPLGKGFWESAEVKTAMAFIRCLTGPYAAGEVIKRRLVDKGGISVPIMRDLGEGLHVMAIMRDRSLCGHVVGLELPLIIVKCSSRQENSMLPAVDVNRSVLMHHVNGLQQKCSRACVPMSLHPSGTYAGGLTAIVAGVATFNKLNRYIIENPEAVSNDNGTDPEQQQQTLGRCLLGNCFEDEMSQETASLVLEQWLSAAAVATDGSSRHSSPSLSKLSSLVFTSKSEEVLEQLASPWQPPAGLKGINAKMQAAINRLRGLVLLGRAVAELYPPKYVLQVGGDSCCAQQHTSAVICCTAAFAMGTMGWVPAPRHIHATSDMLDQLHCMAATRGSIAVTFKSMPTSFDTHSVVADTSYDTSTALADALCLVYRCRLCWQRPVC